MPEPQRLYELQNVIKIYSGRKVLDIPELVIYRGEILGIVGPNGAGKSTLLKLLAFVEPPSSGRITFARVTLSGKQPPLPLRRQVAMVFQRPILLNRSVAANVQYGLRVRGQKNARPLVLEALQLVQMEDKASRAARSLSGGEAQRVALARALVLKPEVLLLDEPTANLDPRNTAIIERTILQASQEQGITVVLVTHNVFQARRLADRIVFLLDGKLVEVASAHAFFETPSDPRSSAFVKGEMIY